MARRFGIRQLFFVVGFGHSEGATRRYFAIVLGMVAVVYAAAYFSHGSMPGNNPRYPLGWWGWFDQGKYLESAQAFVHFDFSPAKHFYPPLYSLLGAFFLPWWGNHPFWLIDLVSLLWTSAVFLLVAERYATRSVAVAVLALAMVANRTILGDFVIPWTSTLSCALLSTGIFGIYRSLTSAGSPIGTSGASPRLGEVFGISLSIGLMASLRPIDALVGGILLVGYLCAVCGSTRPAPPRERWGAVIPLLRVSLAGALVGPLLFIVFNTLVYGSPLGGYAHAALSNGYFIADIPEKFVSLFLNGYTLYLEPNAGLTERFPWMAVSLMGVIYALIRGDWLLRLISAAIVAQFVLYLPYGDLLPNGLWRYHNIHYFKWTFPYLMLLAWLLISSPLRAIGRRIRGPSVAQLFAVGASLLLLSLTLSTEEVPARSVHLSDVDSHGVVEVKSKGGVTDMLDIAGLTGDFGAVYFGEHRLWADDRELRKVRDFRVLPAPWGVRVLLNRPMNTQTFVFQPDSHLTRTGTDLMVQVGHYGFSLAVPFRSEDDDGPAFRYISGDVIDFSGPGHAIPYMRRGWSNPEAWGCWTVDDGARLRLRLANPSPRAGLLEMRIGAFVNERHSRQRVEVLVNGRHVGDLAFDAGSGGGRPRDVGVPLPEGILSNDGVLDVELRTPDSVSPHRLRLSDDPRKLGAGVVWLKIE